MRVLVTNDDGIDAPGLRALAATLGERHDDLVVAAPSEDQSGASASLWRMHGNARVDVQEVTLNDVTASRSLAVAAPPGLIVLAASLGAFGEPPDVVVSGINAGLNTGRSILHSGTVGAALTAQRLGINALAVSLAPGEPWQWQTAATLAADQIETLVHLPRSTALNLNVPSLPEGGMPPLRWATLDPFGSVRAALASGNGHRFQLEMRTSGDELVPDSDASLVAQGYATLTTITGVQECPRPAESGRN